MGAKRGNILTKEIHQCSSCGGFCKKSGCERANTALWIRALEMEFTDDGAPHTKSYHLGWIAGIEAAQQRLMQMHRIASERHNLYGHAALELDKLKEGT